MRLRPLLLATLLLAFSAVPAQAASRLTVRGAGFGHGVGMSQYGALGFAQHGAMYRDILAHYFTGTQISKLGAPSQVRVLLQSGGAVRVKGMAGVVGSRALTPSATYTAVSGGPGVVALRSAGGTVIGRYQAPLRLAGAGGAFTLVGRAANGLRDGGYRGVLEVSPGPSGLMAVNALDLESYIRGVVPAEIPASWPAEALKAQAVAARTYALATRKPVTGFDQYADTRSQVYKGMSAESAASDAAIVATTGEVVTYAGNPVVTYFFSTSGGRTENVENSFIGSPAEPWLRSVEDPYDDASPKHRWGPYRWSGATVKRKLGSLVKGSFRSIRVTKRGASPRIVDATIVGTRGTTTVTGPQLRTKLGLYDTWVYFNQMSTNVAPAPTPTTTTPDPGQTTTGGGIAPRALITSLKPRAELRGRVSPRPADGWVQVQRRTGDAWVDVVSAQVGKGGRYAARVALGGSYRVVSGDDPGPTVRVR